MSGPYASMGPRSFDRGKSAIEDVADEMKELLQWGRDPLTAERPSAATASTADILLQWGRDRSTAESGADRHQASSALASMGPRSFDRGKASSETARSWWHLTSMGPRSFDRGKFLRRLCPTILVISFNGAAIV